MTFFSAHCQLCWRYYFQDEDVQGFRRRDQQIVPVDLKGEQPWAGVWCICKPCLRFLKQLPEETKP